MKPTMHHLKVANPLISIISPSLNQGEFMEQCITSILHQSFKNWEHIVVDGGSTDETLTKLKKYPHIRWISEKDSGYWDAITKGVKMARGKYIMMCMISDGYINKNWLKLCAEILEKDKEVSLVWGLSKWMRNGHLTGVTFPYFRNSDVPQKFDWFYYWLMTGDPLPNGNFCIHKNVFTTCNIYPDDKTKGRELVGFNYNFNTNGFLPYHIPVEADFGRAHGGQLTAVLNSQGLLQKAIKRYNAMVTDYRKDVLQNRIQHVFRDSQGRGIPHKLDLQRINEIRARYLKVKIVFFVIFQRLSDIIRDFVNNKKS